MVKLSEIGEFGLIKKVTRGTVFDGRGLLRGIGDDAAVIAPGEGAVLLVSSDMLVDGVHFIYGKISPFQLGQKAIAVSLSDIAAMGGRARHVLVSLALPGWLAVEDVDQIYEGMKKMLSRWSVNLVGGDTVRSAVLTLDVTVLGEARPGFVLTRGGARPGDVVMVTGTLGDSAAGLEILLNEEMAGKVTAEDREMLLAAHLTPEPRLDQSRLLADLGFVTAMMDVSDGLAGDIVHICEESRVGADIFVNRLPFSGGAARAARLAGKDAVEWALAGGEDYQLLFTVPAGKEEEVAKAFDGAGLGPVTPVGVITGRDGVKFVGLNGDPPGGYRHY